MGDAASIYAGVQATTERLNALIEPYAKQVVVALGSRGYPATLEIEQGSVTPYGYSTQNQYVIHVPNHKGYGRSDHYMLLIGESRVNNDGNPGTTAAYIISEIQRLEQGMYVKPAPTAVDPGVDEESAGTQIVIGELLPYRIPEDEYPTGTQTNSVIVPTPTGDTGTTVPITTQTSTPSSGTVPTTNAASGVELELSSVAQLNGLDPKGTFNGYEIGWLYERTQSSSGYVIGPSELGIQDTERITIAQAAAKIEAYLAGGPTGPKQEDLPKAGAEKGAADWKQVAVIGAMILAVVVLMRALSS